MTTNFPTTVFHYTSNHGLFGILGSKSIRLSGGWNLNDANEGKVFVKHLKAYAGDRPIDKILVNLSKLESYIACFCLHSDLLSQWRGYADDAQGFSIGINTQLIIELIQARTECFFRRVIYADELQDVPGLIKKTFEALLTHSGQPSEGQANSISHDIWTLKNRAFHQEDEYRLTLSTQQKQSLIKFRNNTFAELGHRSIDTGLREYYEFKFGAAFGDLITEIWLGPKNDTHIDVLKRYIEKLGLPPVPIYKSEASYR